jgi:hypothetical protein
VPVHLICIKNAPNVDNVTRLDISELAKYNLDPVVGYY